MKKSILNPFFHSLSSCACSPVRMSHVNPPAYIALIALILIGSFVLILAVNLTWLNINDFKLITTEEYGDEAFYFADSCAEEAVVRIKRDPSYAGGSINIPPVNCVISVSTIGAQKIVSVTGTSGNYSRDIQLTLNLTTSGTAVSASTEKWQEN